MLTPTDRRNLGLSFITPDLATEAGIDRGDDAAGAAAIGRKQSKCRDYSGIIIPYFLPPDYDSPRQLRLRRWIDRTAISPMVGRRESIWARKARVIRFIFSRASLARRRTTRVFAIGITEGEKKALALCRLSLQSSIDPSFWSVALSGVWNFARCGKTRQCHERKSTR